MDRVVALACGTLSVRCYIRPWLQANGIAIAALCVAAPGRAPRTTRGSSGRWFSIQQPKGDGFPLLVSEPADARFASEFFNRRKSLETAIGSMKALAKRFGYSLARDITLSRLNGYVTARLEEGRKLATIRNDLSILKRAFRLAELEGRAICPPFPTLHIRNIREGFFKEEEFQAVRDQLPPDAQPLVTFLYLTGWRLGGRSGWNGPP